MGWLTFNCLILAVVASKWSVITSGKTEEPETQKFIRLYYILSNFILQCYSAQLKDNQMRQYCKGKQGNEIIKEQYTWKVCGTYQHLMGLS